jgi:S1-C subfamily serine protease
MVSNIYPDGAERPVFQTQIPLNPGNSGGPIFDRQGRVAGVVTAGDMQAQSLNFAIRVDQALMRLEGLAGLGAFLTIRVGEVAPIFVNGKMVGSGPHLVIPITPGTHEVFAVVKGTMHRAKVTFPGQREVQLGPPDAEKQDARAEDKP